MAKQPEMLEFAKLGFEALRLGATSAINLYTKLHRLMTIYLAIVSVVVLLGWVIEIFFGDAIIYLLIVIFIPFSLIFLVRKETVIAFITLRVLHLSNQEIVGFVPLAKRMLVEFCNIISSITYAAVWSLILLTYLDFSNNPSSFPTVVAGVMMICTSEVYFDVNNKRVFRAVAVATPQKLFLQFCMATAKLAYALS